MSRKQTKRRSSKHASARQRKEALAAIENHAHQIFKASLTLALKESFEAAMRTGLQGMTVTALVAVVQKALINEASAVGIDAHVRKSTAVQRAEVANG